MNIQHASAMVEDFRVCGVIATRKCGVITSVRGNTIAQYATLSAIERKGQAA
jgi:hypothetical protein